MTVRSSSGLSLLELLVALALLSTIMTGLFAATQFSIGLLDRSERAAAHNVEIGTRVRLRGWLARAASPNIISNLPLQFAGSEKQFSFTILTTPGFAQDAAALRIQVQSEGQDLTMTIKTLDDDGSVLETFETRLAQNASDVQMQYYDDVEADDWLNFWDKTNVLPDLVRITVGSDSVPIWPEFTVALPVSH